MSRSWPDPDAHSLILQFVVSFLHLGTYKAQGYLPKCALTRVNHCLHQMMEGPFSEEQTRLKAVRHVLQRQRCLRIDAYYKFSDVGSQRIEDCAEESPRVNALKTAFTHKTFQAMRARYAALLRVSNGSDVSGPLS